MHLTLFHWRFENGVSINDKSLVCDRGESMDEKIIFQNEALNYIKCVQWPDRVNWLQVIWYTIVTENWDLSNSNAYYLPVMGWDFVLDCEMLMSRTWYPLCLLSLIMSLFDLFAYRSNQEVSKCRKHHIHISIPST